MQRDYKKRAFVAYVGRKRLGACGPKCYDAVGLKSECQCVCKRANHGVGYARALQNIAALKGEWYVHTGRKEISVAEAQAKLPFTPERS